MSLTNRTSLMFAVSPVRVVPLWLTRVKRTVNGVFSSDAVWLPLAVRVLLAGGLVISARTIYLLLLNPRMVAYLLSVERIGV